MKFSERIGKSQKKEIIQIEDIDIDLKNALWNAITICYWKTIIKNDWISHNQNSTITLLQKIWISFFKYKLDEMPPTFDSFNKHVKKFFFETEWYNIYDFIEFLPNTFSNDYSNINEQFIELTNHYLESEVSAYRFIGGTLTKISNEEEISSIEEAIMNSNDLTPVQKHLKRALELFSDRKSPDYRNSIKESISAVESYCSILVEDPNASLGQALKIIEQKSHIHPALKKAFSNLYGYTSEADGIRHALLDEENLKQEDAKFMLVSCSAFINYLISKK